MNRLFFSIILLLSFTLPIVAQSYDQEAENFSNRFSAEISLNKSTGNAGFVRMPVNGGLVLKGEDFTQKTTNFIVEHSALFGIMDEQSELLLSSSRVDKVGFEHLTYEQFYKGVRVFDGQLKFHYNRAGQLQSINGVFIPDIKLNPVPALSDADAEALAVNHVNGQFSSLSSPLRAENSMLYIFRKGLVFGQEGPNHLVYEVVVKNEDEVREFVYVDAHTGVIIQQFTGTHGALFRRLYEVNTGNEIWTEGDPFPGSLDQWQQNEVVAAGHMYHLFNNMFGYDSYDGAGAEMRTINNNPNISCPNATWNGSTANYCTGTAADDVVAHEWGHAYTEYTSGLIYAWQSGALNESYSDIWGETVDLLNEYEDEGEDLSLRTGCGSSQRWRMGEDATAFGGAIRDMWSPICDNDPGKVSDANYRCGSGDNGGVHSNSGVNNHAYALLVDGGTYNGYTIAGIGLDKAAHIFWRSQSEYLTATSNFIDQANALEAAGADLQDMPLAALSTEETPPGDPDVMITAGDLIELGKVIDAVEFRTEPACNFIPLLADTPPLCAGAGENNAFFHEDFETGLDGWTATEIPVNPATWEARNWDIAGMLPGGHGGSAVFGPDPVNGDCTTSLQNGIMRLESPIIDIPGGAEGPLFMSFSHYAAMEDSWDGGNIKYSLNGLPAFSILPGTAFTENGYNGALNTLAAGNDNPLAGEEAFTGTDGGSTGGSWGKSTIDLSSLGLEAGGTIQFQFEVGTDGCNGRAGWYLDNISVYDCSDCVTTLENQATYTSENILVQAADHILSEDIISGTSEMTYSASQSITFDLEFSIDGGSILDVLLNGCMLPAFGPGSSSK